MKVFSGCWNWDWNKVLDCDLFITFQRKTHKDSPSSQAYSNNKWFIRNFPKLRATIFLFFKSFGVFFLFSTSHPCKRIMSSIYRTGLTPGAESCAVPVIQVFILNEIIKCLKILVRFSENPLEMVITFIIIEKSQQTLQLL